MLGLKSNFNIVLIIIDLEFKKCNHMMVENLGMNKDMITKIILKYYLQSLKKDMEQMIFISNYIISH
jgi:hypothetical protein